MKLLQLLNESDEMFYSPDLNVAIETIQKNCGQFLTDAPAPLWRGANGSKMLIREMKTRTDRVPASSNAQFSRLLDDAIEKVVGFRTRSEGTFATGKAHVARDYGGLYLFFPKDGYEFAWSPSINDLYTKFEVGWGNEYISAARQMLVSAARENGDEDYAQDIEGWYDGDIVTQIIGQVSQGDTDVGQQIAELLAKDYTNKGLARAITSGNEIIFTGNYYMVSTDALNLRDISPESFFEMCQKRP